MTDSAGGVKEGHGLDYPLILAGAGLILVATLTSVLSLRFGAPLLLVFLGIGCWQGRTDWACVSTTRTWPIC